MQHSTPQTPPIPTTFHLFPHLPIELRLKIWECNLKSPRLIKLKPDNTPLYEVPSAEYSFTVYFPPCIRPPPLMATCSESRATALKLYTRAFSYHDANLTLKYTYINFTTDILMIDDNALENIPMLETSLIRSLIVRTNHEPFHSFEGGNVFCGPEKLLAMSSLREITIVRSKECGDTLEGVWLQPRGVYEQLLEEEFKNTLGGVKGWVCPEACFLIDGEKEAGDFA